jgi:dTDP-4-amino-4,6-dideoxygalactose transaminase
VPYRYVAQCNDAQTVGRLKAHMADAGVTCIVPVERYELLHNYLGLDPAAYPVCEQVVATSLSVPLYPALTDADSERVAAALARFRP